MTVSNTGMFHLKVGFKYFFGKRIDISWQIWIFFVQWGYDNRTYVISRKFDIRSPRMYTTLLSEVNYVSRSKNLAYNHFISTFFVFQTYAWWHRIFGDYLPIHNITYMYDRTCSLFCDCIPVLQTTKKIGTIWYGFLSC